MECKRPEVKGLVRKFILWDRQMSNVWDADSGESLDFRYEITCWNECHKPQGHTALFFNVMDMKVRWQLRLE